ncbi:hypothetical protein F4141_06225, partial [Candidatus Poribacteria bacterium]|nr:hypothetical protein [Candidatus Poribacteria bacterium]
MNSERENYEKAIGNLIKIMASETKGQNLVDNYVRFLKKEYPRLAISYQQRLEANPTGGRAEAVTFHFLKTCVDEVKINEHPRDGGTDFLCKTADSEFIAEVTSITTDTVTKKSGLKDDLTEGTTVQTFSPITQKLCDTVNSKESQMLKYNYPGILVIASDHPLADTLFDPFDAQRLLVGDMKIGFSIATMRQEMQERSTTNVTELKYSCFLQVNQDWDVCNRSISAVLLFHISGASAFILGILHPDPLHNFSPKLLPSIPFIRLKKWPPEDSILGVEWVKYEENELVVTE